MKTALILNFTGNTYHYGCYGTSFEIYLQLREKGYVVNYVSVRATHKLPSAPQSSHLFMDLDFANKFSEQNVALTTNMAEADIIVVNGEGTLHRNSIGAFTLLYLIYLANKIYKKPTYVINHSVFPNGDRSRGTQLDDFYGQVLATATSVTPRETFSSEFYQRYNIEHTLAFDSLPLFICRKNLQDVRSAGYDADKILLCGGINYSTEHIQIIARIVKKTGKSIEFLLGGKGFLALSDERICNEFRNAGTVVGLIKATTFDQWINAIAKAAVLVSGRFHYTIAALALGVPCIALGSNTPKVEAICDMLGHEGFLPWSEQSCESEMNAKLTSALNGEFATTQATRQYMIDKAQQNYSVIPSA